MGFLDELFGKKQEEMPRGLIVHNIKTPYKAEIMAHFDAAFPGHETQVWEDPETYMEMAVMAPTETEPYYVAYTLGMSAEPMTLDNMPHGKKFEWLRTAELMMFLPGEWPVDAAGGPEHLNDPENKAAAWPLRLLRMLAHMPRKQKTWLGAGHSIPNGEPAHPYAGNTPFAGAVLFLPAQKNGPKEVQPVNIGKGKRVVLYTVVPVYPAEMDYKLEFGAEALERKLRELPAGSGFFVDNARPCTAEPASEEEGEALPQAGREDEE